MKKGVIMDESYNRHFEMKNSQNIFKAWSEKTIHKNWL